MEKSDQSKAERIAKVMARAGVCSRREAERYIADGRVSVNGQVLETPAFTVTQSDKIYVDGKPLPQKEQTRLFIYHKPVGLVTTARDEKGRKTVFDDLPDDLPRVVSVGRLDLNTEGLLLLTNDGELSRALELPSTGWVRRYRVRVHGSISQNRLKSLQKGVIVEGVTYGRIEAILEKSQGSNQWISMSLTEGKNREIRKVLNHLGVEVNRLIRISYGPFQLGSMPRSAVKEIKPKVIQEQCGALLS